MTTPPPGYWTSTPSVPRLATPGGQPPTNNWAWAGLLVSVSGFLIPLGINGVIGVIFSIFGLREARRISDAGFTENGRSLALAGVVVGIVHIVATVALVVGIVLGFLWFYQWIDSITEQLQDITYRGL
jgi:hypothetical protein